MSQNAPDAKQIFLAAIEQPSPEALSQHLDEACQGNADLRSRVEELLQAHRRAGRFLGGSGAGEPTLDQSPLETPGSVIGPYKLLEQIGEGGMGVVFMAEQTAPVRRKVALKVIKPGMDTRQVIARFETERQALAIMDHPNIARVLDVGATEQGRPYFVMELVHGVPIVKYCDDNQLTPRERLELFVPVCQAIQHAHQKGVIHRDIKPSNIMVTLYDGRPVPKVIDFGVAKATEQRLTERSLFTQHGTMVGTLEYMSPEQAEANGAGVDTRSDIYSLGVLLYELLTGSTPLSGTRIKDAAYAEILRLIKEEEPPKPSTRLSDSGEALASISAQRQTEPAKLAKLVRGELDWIVMKCLEKDRNRRYETASGFAADLQRYLDDEPVEACAPSAGYRLRKFARRNRGPVLAAALVLIVLIGGIIGTSCQAIRASRAEDLSHQRLEAEGRQRHRAEENLRTALQSLEEMYTELAQDRLAYQPHLKPLQREVLQKALKFYQDFAHVNQDEPAVRRETAKALHRVGDIQREFGRLGEAEEAYRQATVLFENLANGTAPEPDARLYLARGHMGLGVVFTDTGKLAKAEFVLGKALALLEELVAEHVGEPGSQASLAFAQNHFARLLRRTGRTKEAEQALGRAIALLTDLAVAHRAKPLYRHELAIQFIDLGEVQSATGQHSKAERAHQDALRILEELAKEFPTRPRYQQDLALIHNNRGASFQASREYDEAEKAYRDGVTLYEKLIDNFPTTPDYRHELARTYDNLGILLRKKTNGAREAEQVGRLAVTEYEKLGSEFPAVVDYRAGLGSSHLNLGVALADSRQFDKAEISWKRAATVYEDLVAQFPRMFDYRKALARCYFNLGVLLRQVSRERDAENAYRQAIPHQEKLVVEFADEAKYLKDLGDTRGNLGNLLKDTERLVEAEAEFRQAVAVYRKLTRAFPEEPDYAMQWANKQSGLGLVLGNAGRAEEAGQVYRAAICVLQELAARFPKHPGYRRELALSHNNLGVLLAETGPSEEAENAHGEALRLFTALTADSPDDLLYRQFVAMSHNNLGDLLWKAGRRADAKQAYRAVEQARRLALERGPQHPGALNQLARFLVLCADPEFHKPAEAVELAKQAVALLPSHGDCWLTLGVAHYRAGNWKESVTALNRSTELRNGGDGFGWFFLAMAHWQLGEKDEAKNRYDDAAEYMLKHKPNDEELGRFRAEAAELLGIVDSTEEKNDPKLENENLSPGH